MIGPALHSAKQQTAVKEVTIPLPSLAEWDVATRDYPMGMSDSPSSDRPLYYQSAFQSSNLIGWVGFIRVGLGLIWQVHIVVYI